MDSKVLTNLSTALVFMIGKLDLDERFAIERLARSVTWDSSAHTFPRLVRSVVQSPEDRQGFARRVLPQSGPVAELANGVLWLRPAEQLIVTRREVVMLELQWTTPSGGSISWSSKLPIVDVSPTRLYFALDLLGAELSAARDRNAVGVRE